MKRLVVATALVLGACSAGGPAAAPDTTATPTTPETTVPAEPTTTASASTGPEVSVGDSDFGQILTDVDGNVLYLFMPDDGGESTCYDACADAWPPLLGDPTAGDGADSSLLGTTERTDGSTQVTYGGWPLYYFASDAEPGDTNGQGLNSVWFVVSPDGEAVVSSG